MNKPKLSFIYAYPLDQGQRKIFTDRGDTYPTIEEIKSTITSWTSLWDSTETDKNIIAYLAELTGRIPERSLECFIYGTGLGAMSTPFLLPIWNKNGEAYSDEKVVDVIIHELLHIFITTNNQRYWQHTQTKFANEAVAAQNHILLYAMLYQTYQTLFNSEPLDFNRNDLPPGYARAIQLVKELGYKELITEYKSFI